MKLLLTILACLVAASAGAQTIKSLGYNTTNGVVATSTLSNLPLTFTNLGGIIGVNFNSGNVLIGSNTITFYGTNSGLAFSAGASASQIRNQIQLGATWLTNTNVTNFRTDIGLGATDNVTFSNITANGIVNAKNATLGTATNAATAQGIQWSGLGGAQHAAIYGAYDGVAEIALSVGTTSNALSDVATFRATGMTVSSNAIVGGTLAVSNTATFSTNVTVSGNATLNGVNNTAPLQTADSASSLMTRELSDTRFYPLASFWLPAEEMQSYNSAGAGNPEWTPTAGIINMVTPFGRSPRTVAAPDATGRSQGIYTIPTGWPAGAQVRVTTYLALFSGGATTNTFQLVLGGYWTTNTNIISPVETSVLNTFSANSLLTTNVSGTGITNEYFKISNTFTFATNANRENRQVYVARFSTATNDTATNTIYFIGSHVELLP